MIDKKLLLLGMIIGIVIISTLPVVESAIPPTRAIDRITTSNGTVFGFNSSANVNFIGTGSATVTGSNSSKTVYINVVGGGATTMESLTNVTDSGCVVNEIRKVNATGWYVCAADATGGGATQLNDLTDVTLTAPAYNHILQFLSGQWINKLFAINTQSSSPDFQITGINNQTGVITRTQFSVNNQTTNGGDTWINGIDNVTGQIRTKQFSVNTITCSGTDKVSAINNVTGQVTCSTDSTGGGGTPRTMVDLKATWTDSKLNSNIGTAFINIYEQTNSDGKSIFINSTGYTHVRLQVLWNKVGTGTQTVQVSNGGANVLVSMNVVSGSNDSGWVAIPTCCDETELLYRLQAKSTTGTDDPIFEAAHIWVKGTDSS